MSSSKPNIIALVDAAWGTGEDSESGEGASSTVSASMTSGSTDEGRKPVTSTAKAKAKRPGGKKLVAKRPPPRRP